MSSLHFDMSVLVVKRQLEKTNVVIGHLLSLVGCNSNYISTISALGWIVDFVYLIHQPHRPPSSMIMQIP